MCLRSCHPPAAWGLRFPGTLSPSSSFNCDVGITLPSSFILAMAASRECPAYDVHSPQPDCWCPYRIHASHRSHHPLSSAACLSVFPALIGLLRSCLNCFCYLPCPCPAQSSSLVNIFIMNNKGMKEGIMGQEFIFFLFNRNTLPWVRIYFLIFLDLHYNLFNNFVG